MKHMWRLICMALMIVTVLSLSVSAFAAEYTFESKSDTEYYPSTSYGDVYGSSYNYGGTNLVDYQIPKLPYQRCANRKQIETICTNFLRGIEATKLSITGHMYFVPRTYMDRVDIFEDFITLLSGLNKKQTPLVVNSFYIIDDAKQRDKMTEEFYLAVKKEIATYQEKCDYLIKSSSQSPAVMDRWVLKVQALEEKKRHYETVLQRELDGLDDEFSVLKFLSQELQVRANSIRNQRFQKAA